MRFNYFIFVNAYSERKFMVCQNITWVFQMYILLTLDKYCKNVK